MYIIMHDVTRIFRPEKIYVSNYAVVTPLRKVATYEPRIKKKLHELGKSKRILRGINVDILVNVP